MSIVSLVLIIASAGLLVLGIVQGSDPLVVGSIALSLVAASVLFLGIRRQQKTPAVSGLPRSPRPSTPSTPPTSEPALPAPAVPEPVAAPAGADTGETFTDSEDPDDEPPAERLSANQLERAASLGLDVLVVDGRPRYHRNGCPHLVDRSSEPLPLSEAIELGFNSCALCHAATSLLELARER